MSERSVPSPSCQAQRAPLGLGRLRNPRAAVMLPVEARVLNAANHGDPRTVSALFHELRL